MRSRRYVAMLAVAFLVVTAGCTSFTGQSERQPVGERIAEQATTTMRDAGSYRARIDMRMTVENRELDLTADTVVNGTSERMYLDMSMNMGGRSIETDQYIIGDTQWLRLQGQWRSREVQRDVWGNDSRYERQRRMLNQSEVTLVENTTVDGEPVHVLRVIPDKEMLEDTIERWSGSGFSGDISVQNVTVRQYISRDTSRIRRSETEMTFETEERSGTANVTISFRDFESDLTVELPEEIQ